MTITTKSGFTCELRENALDDYRVLKFIAKLENGNSGETLAAVVGLLERLLPDGQEEALINHVESLNGGVATIEAINDELGEILTAISGAKKN